jgi:hypothetical protein
MKNQGISTSCALIDAGYFSEANLSLLLEAGIFFLIRMLARLVMYRGIVGGM